MKVLRVKDDVTHKMIKQQALDKEMSITDYLTYLITAESKRIQAKALIKGN